MLAPRSSAGAAYRPGTAPRPGTRDRLLAAGRDVLRAHGFRGLTIRAVAAAADANLGSFVYHFGTRDAFVRALIEEWYAPVFKGVSRVAAGGGTALERLRAAVLELVDFGIEHDRFVGTMIMAAADDDAPAREFLQSLAGRHPRLLLSLIAEARAARSLVDEEPMQILCFLMAAVALPLLVANAWQRPPLFGKTLSARLGRIACDRARILQRLDWAIHGLTPRGS